LKDVRVCECSKVKRFGRIGRLDCSMLQRYSESSWAWCGRMRLDQSFFCFYTMLEENQRNATSFEHTTDTALYLHGSTLAYIHYIRRSAGHDYGPRLDDLNVALGVSQPIVCGGARHRRSTAPETFGSRRQAGRMHAVGCQNPCRGLQELTWSIDARGIDGATQTRHRQPTGWQYPAGASKPTRRWDMM
jgi:hypothetical protein